VNVNNVGRTIVSAGRWRGRISWAFAGAILFALIWRLSSTWREITGKVSFDLSLLAWASVALIVYSGIMMFAWHQLLASVVSSIDAKLSARLYLVANLAGYLPGKFASVLAVAHYSEQSHQGQIATGVALVVFQTLNIAAAIVPASLGLASIAVSVDPVWHWTFTIGVAVVAVWLTPILTPPIVRWVSRMVRCEPPTFNLRLWTAARLWFGMSIAWLTIGFSVFLFVHASGVPLSITDLPFVVMAFALSYVTGVLSIIAPGGLGVREGAFAVLLSTIMPSPSAILISLTLRIWMSTLMIVVPLVLLLFMRRHRD
jgi:uncharacterized membrane protein YbhN (UPF0104 family)